MVDLGEELEQSLIQQEQVWACEDCGDQVGFYETVQCKEGCACGRWVGKCCVGLHGRSQKRRVDGVVGPDLLQPVGFSSSLRMASIYDLLPCRIAPWLKQGAERFTPVDSVSAELGLDKTFIKDDNGVFDLKADYAVAATYWLLATRPQLWDHFCQVAGTPSKRSMFLLGFHLALRTHRGGLPPPGPVSVVNRFGIRLSVDLNICG